jgi:four helix bundle protein
MESFSEQLKKRTQRFAVRVIELHRKLPKTEEARVIGRQLLRSATSVAANYRAVRRARSKAEFIAKLGLVVEEADKTSFWLELLVGSNIFSEEDVEECKKEANELLAIFAASYRTARSRKSEMAK